jgi:O-6-methylguanine DNA methyltransferase
VPVTSASYSVDGWGVGEVWLEGPALAWHELPQPSKGTRARMREDPTRSMGGVEHLPPSRSTLPRKRAQVSNRSGPEVEQLINRFRSYFQGEAVTFEDVRLEVHDWTPFQLDCLSALRNVPYGDVVSYSELARLAGHPRAQRAAGTFCAGNRFALVVPCHRVVAADGLGSYSSLGVDYKRRLLALEGVTL